MNLLSFLSDSGPEPFLIPVALKATALLLIVCVFTLIFRRHSAAFRHAVWTFAAVALLLLPILELSLPVWRIAVLPPPAAGAAEAIVETTAVRAAEQISGAERTTTESPNTSRRNTPRTGATGARAVDSGESIRSVAPAAQHEDARSDWRVKMGFVWLAGVFVSLLWMFLFRWQSWRVVRSSRPEEAGTALSRAFLDANETLEIRKRPVLRQSETIPLPCACGIFRPSVILPAEAKEWPEGKLRAVLLHELAHVKRRDCLTQFLAQLCCAVYWFHPLAWHLNGRMRRERECACDDLVLNSGIRAVTYGEALLAVATRASDYRRTPLAGLPMARKTTLEGRLLAILDARRNRRGFGRAALFVGTALCAAVAIPVGALQLGARDAEGGAAEPPPASEARNAGANRLLGIVMDAEGQPVSGASVEVRSLTREPRGTSYGNIGIHTVTDEEGRFVIRDSEPFVSAGVRIDAPALARRVFPGLTAGDSVHELVLTEGVSVSGRVVKAGEPLAGVELGMRGSIMRLQFVPIGSFSATTNEDGRFLFENVPPDTDFYLSGSMDSLQRHGTIPVREVRTGDDETTLEMGDLTVEPGYTVEGEVRLTDGRNPEGGTLRLSRENAAGGMDAVIDAEGRFRFSGVPAGTVSVYTRVDGYRLSLRNASLDPSSPYGLIGRVSADKSDLVLELEPGERRTEQLPGSRLLMREEPLRGVEGPPASGDFTVTGTVVDAETGEPLPSFSVTEGRKSPYGLLQIEWAVTRRTEHTEGTFTTYFTDTGWEPAVLIEADGYLPYSSEPITQSESHLDVELHRGSGPSGVLFRPDGAPAAGVTVYLTDPRNQLNVNQSNGEQPRVSFRGPTTETDGEGRFSFSPHPDATRVVAITPNGIANVEVDDLADSREVQVRPWARVEGRYLIGTEPQENVRVGLSLAHDVPGVHSQSFYEGDSGVLTWSYFFQGTTDGQGRFTFERVPPGPVEVHSRAGTYSTRGVVMKSRTFRIEAEPGKTHSVTLGGRGRPVTGRIVVEGYEGKVDWSMDDRNSFVLRLDTPSELWVAGDRAREAEEAMRAATTDEERITARDEYLRRREEWIRVGREYIVAQRRYAMDIADDGGFRVEDVPGGTYLLDLTVNYGDHSRGHSIRRVEVPASPDGRTDEPYDLGAVEIELSESWPDP